jgi:hypothetical protein
MARKTKKTSAAGTVRKIERNSKKYSSVEKTRIFLSTLGGKEKNEIILLGRGRVY